MSRRASGGAAVLLLAAGLGCVPEAPGEEAPRQALYTPVGVATSSTGALVYVVNSNFNQRFRNGWISAVDLGRLLQGDGKASIVQRLVIPSLAGAPAIDPRGELLLFACRGNGTAVLVEIDAAGTLSCGDLGADGAQDGLSSTEENTDCDRAHLMRIDAQDLQADLTDDYVRDPYATLLFDYQAPEGESRTLAAIGHLRTTLVGFYDIVGDAGARSLQFQRSARVDSPILGGVAQLAVRPGERGRYLAAVSRRYGATSFAGSLYMLDLDRLVAQDPLAVRTLRIQPELGTDQLGGLAFSGDGSRAFATGQSPDSVLMLDADLRSTLVASDDGTSVVVEAPHYDVLSAVPVLGAPGSILYVERQQGDAFVIVAGVREDALYVLRPAADGLELVRQIDDVGQGPYAMAHVVHDGRDRVLVTTFYDHGLAVVDISGDDPGGFSRIAHLRSEEYDVVDRPR